MLKPCEKWDERLSAYLDGESNTTDKQEVEGHLADCPACRAAAEVLRCDAQDISAALARPAAPGFAERVMAEVVVTKMEGTPEPKVETPHRGKPFNWVAVLGFAVLTVFLVPVFFPVFAKAREKSFQANCINNARQLAIGLIAYTQDHDETFPPAANWIGATNLGSDPKIFHCTISKEQGVSYEFNPALSNMSIGELEDVSVVPLVWCKADHSGNMVIAFCDGHVSVVPGRSIRDYARQEKEKYLQWGEESKIKGRPVTPMPDLHVPGTKPTIIPPQKNYGLADTLMIAYTANMALKCEDVQGSMERAEGLFRQYDGFVLASDYQGSEDNAAATVSGRVPSDKLGQLLVDLDGLGTLVSRTVNGDDLTADHLAQLEKLSDLADTQKELSGIGDRAKPAEALNAEDRRSTAASDASSERTSQYKLKSKVVLAEVTVQLSSLPKTKPAMEENPVKRSAAKSFHALGVFCTWLFTGILLPLIIWSPVWGTLLVVGIIVRRRYLKKG